MLLLLLSASGGCEKQLGSQDPEDGRVGDTRVGDAGPSEGKALDKPRPKDSKPSPDLGSGSFTGKPGEFSLTASGRPYMLYVPSSYTAAKPTPLVLGFHGAGDSGSNFYAICKAYGWTQAAAQQGFILLVPATKSPYSDFAVWSGNPNNDVPQMKQEMGEVLAIVKATAKTYNIDASRVHAFGFSDGGLFVGVAGMHYSAELASLLVSGYGWGGSYPLVTPGRTIPVQFLCGSADSFYTYAQASESYLKNQGHPTRFLSASGAGHKFSSLITAYPPSGLYTWMATYKSP